MPTLSPSVYALLGTKAEDSAAASGDLGFPGLSVRQDTLASSTSTDGDYQHFKSDSSGRLHTIDNRTGASAQQVQGYTAVGGSVTTANVFPIGFKDLFNNAVVPTGLDASGIIVMGVLPLDASLNLQSFRTTGEAFALGFATANSTATARFGRCDSDGNITAYQRADSAAVTSVPASATNVTLLAANTARKGATVYNDSSANLYLKMGATASTSSFTVLIRGNGYFEVPAGYTGILDGIWSSATGNARVTEVT